MSENLTQFPSKFVGYPTNRLTAHFSTRDQVKQVLEQAEAFGVDVGGVYILDGDEGLECLDPTGERHGTLAKLSRALHQGGSGTERAKFQGLVEHLSNGGISVAIYAKEKTLREDLIEVYKANGGQEITFAAHFYLEDHR